VVIEAEADPLNLVALIPGRVVAVDSNYGVTIETQGAHVVGACGVGGQAQGILQVLVDNPADELTADDIGMACNRAVIVGGAGLSPAVLERACEMKVAGMVVGSIGAWLHEVDPIPFPIVATEGYGHLPMSSDAFRVLKEVEGHQASIVGGMCDAWNPIQPAVIVSLEDTPQDADQIPESESYPHEPHFHEGTARIGDRVRAARRPLAGQVGQLITLEQETRRMASGILVSGIQVDFDGQKQFVPWLNLEQVG
jgi:hypothetical protein